MRKSIFIFTLLLLSFNYAQQREPLKILNAVKEKFETIHDYEVNAEIKFDIPDVKVPDSKIKIFFKQPDKIKIQSESFVMLPKQGLNFSPTQLMKGDFTAVYVRSENYDNANCDVIKIIPNSDTTDIILSTLWIDSFENIIRKIETTNKKSGTIRIELTYNKKDFCLPSVVKFILGIDKKPNLNTPLKNQNDIENRRGLKQSLEGTVTIIYTDYKINKGIPESFFNSKK